MFRNLWRHDTSFWRQAESPKKEVNSRPVPPQVVKTTETYTNTVTVLVKCDAERRIEVQYSPDPAKDARTL